MNLLDLIEYDYLSPPDYPEPEREGFRNDELDDIENIFDFIGRDNKWGWTVVQLKNTETFFVCIDDELEDDYYYGEYYSEEYDTDNDELVPLSYEVYCSHRYQEGEISKDFDSYEDGKGPLKVTNNSLREMYVYDKDMYLSIVSIIKKHNSKKIPHGKRR